MCAFLNSQITTPAQWHFITHKTFRGCLLGFDIRSSPPQKKKPESSRRNTNLKKMKFPSLIAILGVSATAKMVEVPMETREISERSLYARKCYYFHIHETSLSVRLKRRRGIFFSLSLSLSEVCVRSNLMNFSLKTS